MNLTKFYSKILDKWQKKNTMFGQIMAYVTIFKNDQLYSEKKQNYIIIIAIISDKIMLSFIR